MTIISLSLNKISGYVFKRVNSLMRFITFSIAVKMEGHENGLL